MKLIVTGFDAFGGASQNPSQEAVMAIDPDAIVKQPLSLETPASAIRLVKLTLPTCCTSAYGELKKEVDADDSPFALLLSGLADTRDKICLERFALNVRRFRIPDNNGHSFDEEHIHENGPDAIRTKLPLKSLLKHLDQQGYACDISDHAGTYVCNETYYRSLFDWQASKRCRGILFVHLPPYAAYKHSHINETRPTREVYTSCLESIAQFLASI